MLKFSSRSGGTDELQVLHYGCIRIAGHRTIVPADLEQTRLAAELKAQYQLPHADCFAASLGNLQRATLVTAESDFSLLKKKLSLLLLS
jgi:hypothetical protein